jgi:4-hydroxybenzoate polyprenyltransferase
MRFLLSAVRIFEYFCISAIWIALIGIFWPILLCLVGGLHYDLITSVIIALVTFAIYAADKVSGSAEDLMNSPSRAVLAKCPIKQLAIGAYGLAAIILVAWDPSKLYCVLAPGVAGLIYTARIGGVRPKDIFGMKTLIVASSTAICRAGLVGGDWSLHILVFLMMIIDTVIFDLRDIDGDVRANIRTLPVVIGRRQTLILLAGVAGLIYLISPFLAIMGIFFVLYFRKERHSLSYDLLVDAWALWATGILLLLRWFP